MTADPWTTLADNHFTMSVWRVDHLKDYPAEIKWSIRIVSDLSDGCGHDTYFTGSGPTATEAAQCALDWWLEIAKPSEGGQS